MYYYYKSTNKMIFGDMKNTLDTAVSAPWDTLHTPCFAWGRKRGNGGKKGKERKKEGKSDGKKGKGVGHPCFARSGHAPAPLFREGHPKIILLVDL